MSAALPRRPAPGPRTPGRVAGLVARVAAAFRTPSGGTDAAPSAGRVDDAPR